MITMKMNIGMIAKMIMRIDKNIEYIRQQFLDQINDRSKTVVSFIICAYEQMEIQSVFREILGNIVEYNESIDNLFDCA